MIVKETLPENPTLVKFYSDARVLIHKIGTEEYYGEAIEVAANNVQYEETDMPIEESEESVAEIKEALDIMMGVQYE